MPSWDIPLEILIVLGAALLLGTLAEQVRLSAILGYLVAGTLVGPNVLGLVEQADHVKTIAELGVALLLFTIGLEFSFRRLRRLGRIALLGGTVQVLVTLGAGAVISIVFGLGVRAALAVGAMVALSSTACVLRLLIDRGEIDSIYGRNALGMLLLQDLAVIPLMMLVIVLSAGSTVADFSIAIGRMALLAAALIVGFVVIFIWVIPRLLDLDRWARNRELPILFAIVLALGSAYAAHAASLSPAVGAFIAGVLLGESKFATQIRADVGSLKTVLVTLFFSSIGMLGDPQWVLGNWHLVGGTVLMIVVGKGLIVWGVVRMLGFTHGIAAATALCLAQVGEFSFVLAETSRGATPLITDEVFKLIVSATIATLFLTPFLVAAAPRAARGVEALRRRFFRGLVDAGLAEDVDGRPTPDIVIIGFGPAGQAVAGALFEHCKGRMVVIELNPRSAAVADRFGLPAQLGDATHREVLEHAGMSTAQVVAITVPDSNTTRAIIHLCRQIAPQAVLVARSRYHVRRWELEMAGAHEVVDEETHVGRRIAAVVRKSVRIEPAPEEDAADE
ncbi:MAG: sodium:proton exchanger [Planctomycetes bacterium]|nr:sodium:proton exchanger [Planctomycetota bacterium]